MTGEGYERVRWRRVMVERRDERIGQEGSGYMGAAWDTRSEARTKGDDILTRCSPGKSGSASASCSFPHQIGHLDLQSCPCRCRCSSLRMQLPQTTSPQRRRRRTLLEAGNTKEFVSSLSGDVPPLDETVNSLVSAAVPAAAGRRRICGHRVSEGRHAGGRYD